MRATIPPTRFGHRYTLSADQRGTNDFVQVRHKILRYRLPNTKHNWPMDSRGRYIDPICHRCYNIIKKLPTEHVSWCSQTVREPVNTRKQEVRYGRQQEHVTSTYRPSQ